MKRQRIQLNILVFINVKIVKLSVVILKFGENNNLRKVLVQKRNIMKNVKTAMDQLLNVSIVIIMCIMTLHLSGYRVIHDKDLKAHDIRENKEFMAALIKSSDYSQVLQLAIDTEDKELQNYIINSLVGISVDLEDEEAKKLVTQITLKLLEGK